MLDRHDREEAALQALEESEFRMEVWRGFALALIGILAAILIVWLAQGQRALAANCGEPNPAARVS